MSSKITAPTKAAMIDPIIPPPIEIPSRPNNQPPRNPPRMPTTIAPSNPSRTPLITQSASEPAIPPTIIQRTIEPRSTFSSSFTDAPFTQGSTLLSKDYTTFIHFIHINPVSAVKICLCRVKQKTEGTTAIFWRKITPQNRIIRIGVVLESANG